MADEALDTTGQASSESQNAGEQQPPVEPGQGEQQSAKVEDLQTQQENQGQAGGSDKDVIPPKTEEQPIWEQLGFKDAGVLGSSYRELQRKLSQMGDDGARLRAELDLYKQYIAEGLEGTEIEDRMKADKAKLDQEHEQKTLLSEKATVALDKFKYANRDLGLSETDYVYVCMLSNGCNSSDFNERLSFGLNRFNEIRANNEKRVKTQLAKETQTNMKNKSEVPGGGSQKAEQTVTDYWLLSDEDFQKEISKVRNS